MNKEDIKKAFTWACLQAKAIGWTWTWGTGLDSNTMFIETPKGWLTADSPMQFVYLVTRGNE